MGKRDEELIMEYRDGNSQALDDLFQRYHNPILNFAFRMLHNSADAEDVVGEVFYTIASKKTAYKPRAKFSTWLYTVAHNICITKIRKRRRFLSLFSRKDTDTGEYRQRDIPDPAPTASDCLDNHECIQYLKIAIDTLPTAQKEALILREYHSFCYEEIAKIMKCSLGRVKVLLFRAREQLRNELKLLREERA